MIRIRLPLLAAMFALLAHAGQAQGPSIPYDGLETGALRPFDCNADAGTPREIERCDAVSLVTEVASDAQRCLLSSAAQGCGSLREDIRAARAAMFNLSAPQATAGSLREAVARDDARNVLFPDEDGAPANRPRSEPTRFDE